MIAMGLSCRPKLLIADEPTTALDVTIQAQIVELIKALREEIGMAIIWITHDLAFLAGLADRILVMYAGQIVEEAPLHQLYKNPRHPYTIGLLQSIPAWMSAAAKSCSPLRACPRIWSTIPRVVRLRPVVASSSTAAGAKIQSWSPLDPSMRWLAG